jgi:hypothetical protein
MVKGKFQQSAFTMLSYGILWGIWIARNKLIFEDNKPDWNTLFQLIFHHLELRLKSWNNNFLYPENDLIRGLKGILEWSNK